ncbi:MAG: ion transporter [Lachnospiraceae bacterium]|nr:ion transporter [Lachnospiraceae bacterium]
MRRKIYELVRRTDKKSRARTIYNGIIIFAVFVSVIPLAFKEDYLLFEVADKIAALFFLTDYIFRFITADFKYAEYRNGGKKRNPFLRFPFSPMAIIDLLSILPSIVPLNSADKSLRMITRLMRALRVFRIFKVARYSKNIELLVRVLKRSKDALLAVVALALAYILISALVIYNVEPETFSTFFDAIYWATVSLTTMGYGDIYPVTNIGRTVTMVSAMFGIAVVALPAGIITAEYMNELLEEKRQ